MRTSEADDRFASGYHGDHVTLQGRLGRYTNYQAGLALRQLERLTPRLERRIANAHRLIEPLRDAVTFQEPAGPEHRPNYMLVTARFANMLQVADELLRRGVDTKHHYMRDCTGLLDEKEPFPNATRAEAEVLHLPAYPELSGRQIDKVVAAVREVTGRIDCRPADGPGGPEPAAVDVHMGPAAKGLASAATEPS
jgi:dTDP-4-amino-4,6-dideoxygalactose transaminase